MDAKTISLTIIEALKKNGYSKATQEYFRFRLNCYFLSDSQLNEIIEMIDRKAAFKDIFFTNAEFRIDYDLKSPGKYSREQLLQGQQRWWNEFTGETGEFKLSSSYIRQFWNTEEFA